MAQAIEYSIGVDLGGTNLRAAAVGRDGKILGKHSGSTNLKEGRDAVIDDVVASIRVLQDQFGQERLAGVGVAMASFIRMKEGIIANSNNLPSLEGVALRDEISRRLGKPVILENDANATALGEKWLGAGKDVNDLVLLTLGTDGGGVIVNGRVMRGFVGMAGELGHMTIVPSGNPCGCGNTGCLEKHASATAISTMARLLQLGENLTSEQVFRIATQDNSEEALKARRVFEAMGTASASPSATWSTSSMRRCIC